jgi:hypothetical protein
MNSPSDTTSTRWPSIITIAAGCSGENALPFFPSHVLRLTGGLDEPRKRRDNACSVQLAYLFHPLFHQPTRLGLTLFGDFDLGKTALEEGAEWPAFLLP